MAGARSNNGLAFTHTVMHWPHVQQNPARTSCRHRRPPVADRSGTHEAASGSQLPPAGALLPAIPALPGRAGWRSSLAPWARCRSAKVFRLMQGNESLFANAQDMGRAQGAKKRRREFRTCGAMCLPAQPSRIKSTRKSAIALRLALNSNLNSHLPIAGSISSTTLSHFFL